ncbi:non-ribosomal peptide synthetase, partial [Alteromonas sp. ASW11-130]|uniref:non-ribosomal peptide synthetase n=1 Tax=Alteromonas sp. ASW11-130 TaxID=3015775 RepID=UPI0022425308
VPGNVIVVAQWPLTPNGKIDKKALPTADATALQGAYVAPSREMETELAILLSELLGIDKNSISMSSNFFDLGGHSLLAVRFVSLIEANFNKKLSIKGVFESDSIASLARLVELAPEMQKRSRVCPIKREADESILSSYAQQRIWFIDQLQGGSPEYNMPLALTVEGRFELNAAELALSQIIKRHEALRTVFAVKGDETVQIIKQDFSFNLVHHDVSMFDTGIRQLKVKEFISQDRLTPFDLRNDLMIRASYIKIGEELGVLIFNMHHIASDGWSTRLLVDEFVANYSRLVKGLREQLPVLAIQYADYAQWQRDWLKGEVLEQQLSYWEKQLEGVPAVHSIPLDFSRTELSMRRGALVKSVLNPKTAQKLKSLAVEHKMTLFMLLHAGIALLISRHSNSTDIVIGTPVANRMQSELEDIIGFFANTLVLRANTEYKILVDYLAHIKSLHQDAQSHQDIPFEKLVEHCNVTRSTEHTPLFQILFSMNTAEQGELEIPGVKFSPVENETYVAKFDLDISAREIANGIELSWIYDTSIFTHEHVEQFSEHLNRLLSQMAEAQNDALSQLSMLSDNEVSMLTEQLNSTSFDNPSEQLIHELFELQADSEPEKVAMTFAEKHMTYGELNSAANKLAHYLRERGVVENSAVGLYVNRGFEMIIGILGIMKAGGAYVPLEPSFPESRLQYILDELQLAYILDGLGDCQQFELPHNCKVMKMVDDFFTTRLEAFPSNSPNFGSQSSESLAYILYTSGSTGKPKGIKQTHRTISNLIYSTAEHDGVSKSMRTLQFTPYTFDVSIQELATCWFTGSCLIGISAQTKNNLNELPRLLLAENVERLFIPPAVLQFIAEQVAETQEQLPDLKEVFSAGEELIVTPAISAFLNSHPNCRLWNCYGPTETHVVTMTEIQHNLGVHSASIGKPINNTKLYLLDMQGNLAPYGSPGELYVSGAGLAKGYIDSSLNSGRFINNTFDNAHEALLYKTGDLVRYLPDGNLEFIGRADEQVSINGFRVELGEIEKQVSDYEKVNSCVISYRKCGLGIKRLMAYLVLKEQYLKDIEFGVQNDELTKELGEYLAKILPSYMLPSSYIVLEQFPLTANGKIDKKKLPLPELGLAESEIIAPSNEVEEQLVEMMSELLQVAADKISVNYSFFELGLSSLRLFSCVNYINKEFGLTLTVADLYKNNTVQLLAGKINEFNLLTQISADEQEEMSFIEDGEI